MRHAGGLQRFLDLDSGGGHGGRHAKQHAGRKRQTQSEGERGQVDGNRRIARKDGRFDTIEQVHRKPGDANAGYAARHREYEAFHEHLADDTAAVGAESQSNGEFAPAATGAGEQQIGEIHTRDRKDQSGGAAYYQKRGPQLTRQVLLQRIGGDDQIPSEPGRENLIFGPDKISQAIQVRVYFFSGHANLTAGKEGGGEDRPRGHDRPMKRFVQRQGHPDLCAAREVEALRHDADDGARQTIDGHGLSGDICVAAQAASPEVVAQNDRGRRLRPFFLRPKITPYARPHAHHAKERCRNLRRIQLLRSLHAGPVHVDPVERGNFFEDPVTLAQTVIIRHRAYVFAIRSRPFADPVDALGAGIGERPDKDRVPDAENGSVRSDANSECKSSEENQQGLAAQAANSARYILETTRNHSGTRSLTDGSPTDYTTTLRMVKGIEVVLRRG